MKIVLPVKVFGSNARGEPFNQTACVTDVSRSGARLEGAQCISKVGETLVLEHSTRRARFRVAWLGAPGTRQAGCAGLRNLEPEKAVFGVTLPPPGPDPYEVPGLFVDRRVQDRRQETERRRYTRYKCMGTVEIRKEGTDVPMWAKISDICLGGCYVEVMSPFPVDTRVNMVVNVGESRVQTNGLVRSHHPGFGMGIAFVETRPEQMAALNRIVAALALASQHAAARPNVVAFQTPAGRPPQAALDALKAWFGIHDTLTRDDFLRLLGQPDNKETLPTEVVVGRERF